MPLHRLPVYRYSLLRSYFLLFGVFFISSCAVSGKGGDSSPNGDKDRQVDTESRWDEGVYTTVMADGNNCLGTNFERADLKLFFDPVTYAELGNYPLVVSQATSQTMVGAANRYVYGDMGIDGRYDLELRLYAEPFTGKLQTRFYKGASYTYPGVLSCEAATMFEFDRTGEGIGKCFTCDFDGVY